MKLHKKVIITGTLELLTGLHIGDSKDNVEIGGVDNPIIRRKDNNQPYIPGSSIKGKMRSLLEVALGENHNTDFKGYSTADGKTLAHLFGSAANDGTPARLLIRDANLTQSSAQLLSESEFTDMPYTEVKFENTINRITGVALNPRQTERVPAGSVFDLNFVINIITVEGNETEAQTMETNFIKLLYAGIRLLEDDYLGGSGSRGYGQVKLSLNEPVSKTVETYLNPA